MTAVYVLHRTFPCCGGRSRFVADAPAYARVCRRCGTAWTVRRIARPPSDFARRLGGSFVALEWEREPNDKAVTPAVELGAPNRGAGATAANSPPAWSRKVSPAQ